MTCQFSRLLVRCGIQIVSNSYVYKDHFSLYPVIENLKIYMGFWWNNLFIYIFGLERFNHNS